MSYIKAIGLHGRPGYAIIEIGYVLSVDPLLLTIQKAGRDQRYLAADGHWDSEPKTLQPISVECRAKCTLIFLGPDIVNRIDDSERIRVAIPAASFEGEVLWSDIAPSADYFSGSPFEMPPKLVPAAAAASPPEPAPLPATPAVEREALPSSEVETIDDVMPAVPPTRRRRAPLWISLVFLLVLLAGGGAIYWDPDLRQRLLALVHNPSDPQVASTLATTGDDLPRVRERLAQMMEADGDAGQILDGGMRLFASDDAGLCAFGLGAIRFAARKSASAKLKLSKLFDPREFHRHCGIDQPQPGISAEYYRDAGDAGAEDLKGLCEKLARPGEWVDENERASVLAGYCK